MSSSPGLPKVPVTAATAPAMTQVVQRLTQFWVERGHVLLPPCDFAIPAGSMHPEVFFNVLDERPWGTALVQPVRRPRDGRRGLHPFRLAKHLEFHVLLRSHVEAMQDLYLESLQTLGLDLTRHDICFSDGPWESHSLGAWGNGWHVQLNGLGVARLTFLRHMAGRPLVRPAAEMVYGIERTALVMDDVAGLEALSWGLGAVDGEPWRRGEEEMSRYAFEVADATSWQRSLERREEEARRCLDAGLPRIAYELAVGNLEHVELLLARGQLEVRHRVRHLQRVQELVLAAAQVARSAVAPTESVSPVTHGTEGSESEVSQALPDSDETEGSVEVDATQSVAAATAAPTVELPEADAGPEGDATESATVVAERAEAEPKPVSAASAASTGGRRKPTARASRKTKAPGKKGKS